METFLRLDLSGLVFFLDTAEAGLPGDPLDALLLDKIRAFAVARLLARDVGVVPFVAVARAGGPGLDSTLQVPFGLDPEAANAAVQEAFALGDAGRLAQASVRYRGTAPFEPLG